MPSSSDDPELDVSGIFPDPDMVGTSEYFAVYDLVSRTMEDDGIETRKLSELRLIHSQLAELSAVAMTKMTEVEKLLLAHGDQTAG